MTCYSLQRPLALHFFFFSLVVGINIKQFNFFSSVWPFHVLIGCNYGHE